MEANNLEEIATMNGTRGCAADIRRTLKSASDVRISKLPTADFRRAMKVTTEVSRIMRPTKVVKKTSQQGPADPRPMPNEMDKNFIEAVSTNMASMWR